ncbi:hypothetical protein [Tuwongella immobilis]|uniref:Uncharacterized protein n=1 Tax=Tuwongella immobilis TaxID=692036 RepID=A0A6C2YPL8_9BACT|nr:hypothetical protein [Tuwongella immobilis]VIP03073.1 unnamed protein product [Tuwongella immobilis]VTS03306.1 unnamed protein product [Tuwongella immobilis]
MAKQKPTADPTPTIEPAPEFELVTSEGPTILIGTPTSAEPASLSETEVLNAKLEQYERENAMLRAQLENSSRQPQPTFTSQEKPWLVKVQEGPAWVVLATNEASAWAAYRQATGLISTPYQPEIGPMPPSTPVGRYWGE